MGIKLGGVSIGLFRVGARCYAVHDICTHEYALLSKGFQEGEVVECPLHVARFSVTTGKCLGPPADRDLRRFDLRIVGDEVQVDVPDGQGDRDLLQSPQ